MNISPISIPSLLFSIIFFWNGCSYILFSRIKNEQNRINYTHFFFGLTSLLLSAYSFATFRLYSSQGFESAFLWQKIQIMISVPLFIFFVYFSLQFLRHHSVYWSFVVPFGTSLFLPFVFVDDIFFSLELAPKIFSLFGENFSIHEAKAGPLALMFFLWGGCNLVALGYLWFSHYRKKSIGWLLPSASVLFCLTAINDILVTLRVYNFIYLLEFGSLISILAMAYHLFREFRSKAHELIKKKNDLEEANKEIRFVLQAISHDLQSPLFAIQGFLDLIEMKKNISAEKLQHYLKRIRTNIKHTQNLLNDLVSYLKIGHNQESWQDISLSQLVSDLEEILDMKNLRPRLKLETTSAQDVFQGPLLKLKHVLMNLLQNSVKYNDKEFPYIQIGLTENNDSFQICVSDNGPGVPKEYHERIFDAFFRYNIQSHGSGMGLAIVKKTLQSIQGEVWIDPEYDKGLSVVFQFPKKAKKILKSNSMSSKPLYIDFRQDNISLSQHTNLGSFEK